MRNILQKGIIGNSSQPPIHPGVEDTDNEWEKCKFELPQAQGASFLRESVPVSSSQVIRPDRRWYVCIYKSNYGCYGVQFLISY